MTEQSLFARDNGLRLRDADDALDVLSSDLPGCIFTVEDLPDHFFELSNGLAGEVFQKFVNYNYRIAIVLPHDHKLGARVTELVYDHRTHPCIRFFSDESEAQDWLSC
jgi:hypothetical protein